MSFQLTLSKIMQIFCRRLHNTMRPSHVLELNHSTCFIFPSIVCMPDPQVCTAMGCSAGFATAPLSGKAMRACAVQHSVSLAWRLGRAILAARHAKSDPVAAAAAEGHGKVVFSGIQWSAVLRACCNRNASVDRLRRRYDHVIKDKIVSRKIADHAPDHIMMPDCVPRLGLHQSRPVKEPSC